MAALINHVWVDSMMMLQGQQPGREQHWEVYYELTSLINGCRTSGNISMLASCPASNKFKQSTAMV
jgi:hypothetical protein